MAARSRLSGNARMLFPALALLVMFFVLPLVEIWYRALAGPTSPGVSGLGTQLVDPLFVAVLANTLTVSLLVAVSSLMLAWPLAALISHSRQRFSIALLSLVVSCMWLSVMLRSFSWMILLQRDGIVLSGLRWLSGGTIESLLFSRAGVVIGMTYVLMPMVVLIILLPASRLGDLRQAARLDGATPALYFVRVFVPETTVAGAIGGCLVFLLSIGFFITPELLGGGASRTMMLGVLVNEQVNEFGNWHRGTLIAMAGTVVVGGVIAVLAALRQPIAKLLWVRDG